MSTSFIIAMNEEINLQELINKKILELIETKPFNIYKVITKQEYYLIISSIGMINSASACQYMIDHYHVQKFINLGSAGTTNKNNECLEPIIITNSIYGDADLTAFGYQINQMARQPILFKSNELLMSNLQKILEQKQIKFKIGTCATINSFINQKNKNKFDEIIDFNPECIEMELVGIAQNCFINQKEWISLKIISDSILNPSLSQEQFNENMKKIANLLTQIIIDWL